MNKTQEDRSLTEVREWKEQCRQEGEGLTSTEYLEELHKIGEQIKNRYHIKLREVSLFHEKH